jgi:putative endonuclease
MHRNQRTGEWGEQAAAEFLSGLGYEILARNVRTPHGEIDLVAQRTGQIVFVEVKTRTTRAFGPPEISVGPRKQAHMVACAQHYAQENSIDHWQIDVVAVEKLGTETKVKHFENALN